MSPSIAIRYATKPEMTENDQLSLAPPLKRHSQGVDMDVPLITRVLLPGDVLRMFSPGAKTSILPEVANLGFTVTGGQSECLTKV